MLPIRALVPSDAPEWARIREESLAADPLAFGQDLSEHHLLPLETIAGRFRNTASGNFTLGAFDESRLAAIATFVRDSTVKQRHKGYIYGVYVAPAHRGRGLARALLSTLIDRARQDPTLEQIHLAVTLTQAPARALYKSLGFVPFGLEPRALKIDGAYVDQEHMLLRLR